MLGGASPVRLLLESKMQVVSGERSLWIYTLLFTSLQLWGRLSASTSSPNLPPPQLDIHSRSRDSVVLICGVPKGYTGVVFMLYRLRERVDSQELQSGAEQALFTVRIEEGDSAQHKLFCCLYRNQQNLYSAFSPYLQIDQLEATAPPRSIPSAPPPVLSVEPSAGVVKHGDMLTFSCSVPALLPQSQSQSTSKQKQVSFLLLRTAEGTGETTVIQQPQGSKVSNPEPQSGVFSVGPVRGGEDGEYTCLYQTTRRRRLVNSTVSNVVQVTITDVLPVPTLVLQQQTAVWRLLCMGSPSYPGAVFSLYLADHDVPVATLHAKVIHHEVAFPMPVQDSSVSWYRCQYSVLLGGKWSHSELSLPLAITGGVSPTSSTDFLGVDWPLVLGCFSAVVLFLCSVALVVMVARRKVKAAAEEKKKRQDEQFWTQVHAKDHVVDLPLSNFASQEWACGDSTTETTSRSPLWNSLSTFTTPIHPVH
ncbi:uncharacterized protein LOC122972582 [Thunnus albacares]|uniref:uncharacterized protein LOC122972582 n=1 Tax=Thunnus albacares TaxID=8236 RepID=UPI001CF70FF8|nr:uncharacterized protein LOC122972582 [Thunnus albacares]